MSSLSCLSVDRQLEELEKKEQEKEREAREELKKLQEIFGDFLILFGAFRVFESSFSCPFDLCFVKEQDEKKLRAWKQKVRPPLSRLGRDSEVEAVRVKGQQELREMDS